MAKYCDNCSDDISNCPCVGSCSDQCDCRDDNLSYSIPTGRFSISSECPECHSVTLEGNKQVRCINVNCSYVRVK